MSEAGEQESSDLAAEQLGLVLARIPHFIERYAAIALVRPEPGSGLASDDDILNPLEASQLVATCLAASTDYLSAIETLMVEDGEPLLYTFAQYPLLRSLLEASSMVLWLLGPGDQRERVLRNLRARYTESLEDARLFREVPADEARASKGFESQKRARAIVADRTGIGEREFEGQKMGFGEVVEGGQTASGDTTAKAAWQLMSGFAHSFTSRSRMLSTVVPILDAGERANRSAMSAHPKIVLFALNSAMSAFDSALTLVEKRSRGSGG
ncbi:hypothetical protein BKA04_000426 [Cryobacterium mesophilum]|uniref:Uncharacterized protein n=1 Tax=Terrimesophilobacter mesophilus TaxID=433647 RepID=A0A4R8V7G6_9MICO|nr:hypothetical protein [Terrimesophilobacter mesophilus]MBB5632203.1 hypothetical protein [Terrimesophilobacter mesophilus]TFB79064.1 hypothetical protein E3N84_02695 [Terrimesophilobacter mesophilus]